MHQYYAMFLLLQAGLLTNFGSIGTGVCGGCLVSVTKLVTAAHCWFDGEIQGRSAEVVLGSTTIFTGGSRQVTDDIIMHPFWNPNLIRDDVAVITLENPVQFSSK